MSSKTMYGFEGRVDGVWSQLHCGQQGPDNYLSTREEAEAGLPRLADALETELSELRVVAVAVDVPDAPLDAARAEYAALCESLGTDQVAEENALLSIGREHLPPCAIAVLEDRDAATVEYYDWLTSETQAAQDAHDAEVAAGHEWHGPGQPWWT